MATKLYEKQKLLSAKLVDHLTHHTALTDETAGHIATAFDLHADHSFWILTEWPSYILPVLRLVGITYSASLFFDASDLKVTDVQLQSIEYMKNTVYSVIFMSFLESSEIYSFGGCSSEQE